MTGGTWLTPAGVGSARQEPVFLPGVVVTIAPERAPSGRPVVAIGTPASDGGVHPDVCVVHGEGCPVWPSIVASQETSR